MAIAAEDLKTLPSFDVDADELRRVLGNALLFTSKDGARPVLCAVLVEVSDGKVRAVATDSYKLAHDETSAEVSGYGKFLMAREDVNQTVKALKAAKRTPVRVSVEDSAGNGHHSIVVEMAGAGARFVFGAVEGDYPNYEMLIPAETTGTDQPIGLGLDHLAAFCKVDAGPVLKWEFNGPLKPAVCRAGSFVGLLMPARL